MRCLVGLRFYFWKLPLALINERISEEHPLLHLQVHHPLQPVRALQQPQFFAASLDCTSIFQITIKIWSIDKFFHFFFIFPSLSVKKLALKKFIKLFFLCFNQPRAVPNIFKSLIKQCSNSYIIIKSWPMKP